MHLCVCQSFVHLSVPPPTRLSHISSMSPCIFYLGICIYVLSTINQSYLSIHTYLYMYLSSIYPFIYPHTYLSIWSIISLRESTPRQVDKKSGGPQGERGLEFSRRKGQTFFFILHSLGLCNNNVSCLRTASGKKKKTFWLILLS